MEKIKNKKTAYVAIEVVGVNNAKVSARVLDMLKYLHDEGLIEDYELFVTDSHPLKEAKKLISTVLYEVMKIKDFSNSVHSKIFPILSFLSEFANKKK